MSFTTPAWLLGLLAVAALAVAYVVTRVARRDRELARFGNVELLRQVAPARPGWRRHLPAAAMLVALAAAFVALAGPTRTVTVPVEQATVVMAMDVSVSMMATDVEPSRIDAAKDAAKRFVDALPPEINLGLVAFDGTARVLVSPTTDRAAVRRAIDGLELGERTAIGDAVVTSLDAVRAQGSGGEAPGSTNGDPAEPSGVPAHVVLMSDGETTVGTPNEQAVEQAVEEGVPVSTIAFGTPDGVVVYQGEVTPVPVNGPALEEIARATGGQFYEAASGDELRAVYADIGSLVGYETEERDVTAWFVGVAAFAGLLAAALSLLWSSRLA